MLNKELFGKRLKELRERKGMTQENIAEIISTTRTQVSDMEKGKTTTRMEKLYILAEYFNISADYLLGRSDDDSPFREE